MKNQIKLKLLGYYDGAIDDINGPKQKAAVKEFQKDSRLTIDGIIGVKTQPKLDRAFIWWYQTELKEQGYYEGAIDGVHGALTEKAVRAFQKDHGLVKDGIVGLKTGTALISAEAKPKEIYTEHFKREEFKCNCDGKYCNGYPLEMHPTMISNLEIVKKHFGGKPVVITSGLRCQEYNDSLKGSIKKSKHTEGKASDVYIKGVTDNDAGKNELISLWMTLPGANYAYSNDSNMKNAVHLDIK